MKNNESYRIHDSRSESSESVSEIRNFNQSRDTRNKNTVLIT
jgi:hypothetical protein